MAENPTGGCRQRKEFLLREVDTVVHGITPTLRRFLEFGQDDVYHPASPSPGSTKGTLTLHTRVETNERPSTDSWADPQGRVHWDARKTLVWFGRRAERESKHLPRRILQVRGHGGGSLRTFLRLPDNRRRSRPARCSATVTGDLRPIPRLFLMKASTSDCQNAVRTFFTSSERLLQTMSRGVAQNLARVLLATIEGGVG